MIVLATLNSQYHHSAFGLRYLLAQMGDLEPQTRLLEFTLEKSPRDIAEEILADSPRIVGLGVYIWNARESLELVRILKAVAPEVSIILGGPEVSYETDRQEIAAWADYVIAGEGDLLFAELCREILSKNLAGEGSGQWRPEKLRRSPLPELSRLRSPYRYYTDEDIRNRVIYVEASRGCPYKCEYCLSSLDLKVRQFPLQPLLEDFRLLIERGARSFKFIDRTFNLSPSVSVAILQFFLQYVETGLFLHFEMVPDRLPPELRELIRKFPAGSLQFEVGIQTLNPEVAANVSRKNDLAKVRENFRFLREQTGVHVHADLIVGLPGESLESFGRGLDELYAMGPQEIQVGILKRLRGTPIARHEGPFEMAYAAEAPYAILKNRDLSYQDVQEMTRFSRYWDLIVNSGEFVETVRVLHSSPGSRFEFFRELSRRLYAKLKRTHKISLLSLVQALHECVSGMGVEKSAMERALLEDYSVRGRRDVPAFLKGAVQESDGTRSEVLRSPHASAASARQQRHLK